MTSIKNLFHINAPVEKVYQAITTVEGLSNWWTIQTSGDTNAGGILQFRFGDFGGPDMKVKDLKTNGSVTWECIAGPADWIGTIFTFNLDENEGKTRIRFEQAGWKEANDFYASCTFTWGRYMESLRQYCQAGKGAAFGSAGYK